jgi:hypothetical protein
VLTVSIEPKSRDEFIATLRQFAADCGLTMRDACIEQAALACVDAATFTPPMPKGGGRGLTKDAQRAGNNAIDGDVRKMFVAADDKTSRSAPGLLMNQMAYAVKSGNFGSFQKIMASGHLVGMNKIPPIVRKIAGDQNYDRAFKKAKNYYNTTNIILSDYGTQGFVNDIKPNHNRIKGKFGGRIPLKVRPVKVPMLVDSAKDLKDYIQERQQMVGSIKSGWLMALLSLPKPIIKGVPKNVGVELMKPAWIKRHNNTIGRSTTMANQSNVEVSVINNNGNVNNIAVTADTLGLVYGNRVKQMKARFSKHFDDTIKETNSRRRPR